MPGDTKPLRDPNSKPDYRTDAVTKPLLNEQIDHNKPLYDIARENNARNLDGHRDNSGAIHVLDALSKVDPYSLFADSLRMIFVEFSDKEKHQFDSELLRIVEHIIEAVENPHKQIILRSTVTFPYDLIIEQFGIQTGEATAYIRKIYSLLRHNKLVDKNHDLYLLYKDDEYCFDFIIILHNQIPAEAEV